LELGDLVEEADRWVVPITGLTVTQCQLDYAFTIIAWDHERGSFAIRLEQPFTLLTAGRVDELVLDPEQDPLAMAPALCILRATIEDVIAFKDGRLELSVEEGHVVRARAGEEYESWTITGPAGLMLVSLPSGGLATWRP